jgi:2-polyprenyl-6-methoxyphenol hydroxylase-like FAD-dependent oxidoreductase
MSTGSETRMAARRILIIGAGIAGLSLNAALGDGPWQVEVVERGAGAYALGAGLAIQPNAMRVLRRLGLGDAVERAGAVIDRFQYRDQDGGLLCDIDLDSVWDRVGPFVGITRTALHEVLRSGPDRCRFGTSVTSVTQRGGHVAVSFADGTTTPYDLVVGADGINSVARRSLGDRPAPAHGGQMAGAVSRRSVPGASTVCSSGWARIGSSACARPAPARRTVSAISPAPASASRSTGASAGSSTASPHSANPFWSI